MTNEELLSRTEAAVKTEKRATAEVVRLFAEIYSRRLFLDEGYGSLFDMAVKHFGYCPSSAMIRINAMKLISRAPEVEAKIESGEITLTVAANIQSFSSKRDVDVLELVETCAGKSVREVEREFAKIDPEIERREFVKQVSEDRVRVSHGSSNQLEEKLQKIKEMWSHKNPNPSREELLEMMADFILREPKPRQQVHAQKVRTRYIPRAVKREVPKTGCEFVSATGRRCGSNHQLQYDHIEPYAQGGANTAQNLRMYCAQHNRARQTHVSERTDIKTSMSFWKT